MTREELYTLCYEAFRWAEEGVYETGSNYWMTMFVDKLQEKIEVIPDQNI